MKRIVTYMLWVSLAFFTAFFNMFGSLNKWMEDNLYHHPNNVNSKIRIIKIDDRTMNQWGDFTEWDRDVYAQLVEKLCVSEDIKPAVIGFDVLFSSEKGKETDKRFAEACEEYGNVVTCFSYSFTKKIVADENGNLITDTMSVHEKVVPYKELGEATVQGFANALMDNDDSIIRSSFLYFDEEDGTREKSFSAAVYEKYMEACGKSPVYPTDEMVMSFRYSGGVSDYENVSLYDVLNGTIPPEAFDDCIVLVGAYAAGMMDAYFIPVDRGQQMYGVEIHANVIQAIMESKTLTALPAWMDGLIAAVIAFLLVWICEKLSVVKTLIVCVAVAAAKLGLGAILFNQGYLWNNLIVPVIAILIAIYYTALHYYRARAAKLSIEKAFNKYVAPQVVSELACKL